MTMMTKRYVFYFLLLFVWVSSYASPNPQVNAAAVVAIGNARFTMLTPELIRMEWAEDGVFDDRASLIFTNRNLPVPQYRVAKSKDRLVITTSALVLTYKSDSKPFSKDNLSIEFKINTQKRSWNPSMQDIGNLGGTARTLDGYIGDTRSWSNNKLDMECGVASRDGWAVIKDSAGVLFDGNADKNWAVRRAAGNYQDWYFFGYGHNYKKAIYDYTQVAGKIPMPPRYVFGYWWCRWWAYSDAEIRALVAEMKANNIPLDVFIIDMDWHYTFVGQKTNDSFGEVVGWTGYTWNKELFPQPENLFGFFKTNNIKSALNLHPASGVPPTEEHYAEFAKALNIDTSKPIPFDKDYARLCQKERKDWDTTSTRGAIPCDLVDKNYVDAYFNILLRPIERQGADFWWIDWQQHKWTKILNLNNTWWVNYLHFTDMERNKAARPLVFHRWGGLGNHRYPIGFSGDALVAWQSLKFQTYFTATAANVGYSYWSHDIGGNGWFGLDSVKKNFTDPELFTRWFQFGVLSPVLRTHSDKSRELERRIWMYKDPYNKALRNALNLRYELAPYIYNSARMTYDSALSLCLPMYYHHPEKEEAYQYKYQYYFGNEMIAAPVTDKMNASGLAQSRIWLPKGTWYEWHSGTLLKGDTVYNRRFTINDMPLYVKAGAVIPMNRNVKNLSQQADTVVWTIFPGATKGSGYLYEDNGDSKAYTSGEYAVTKLNYNIDNQGKMSVIIEPAKGEFAGKLSQRTYIIRLVNTLTVNSVVINGMADIVANAYNAFTLSNEICTGRVSVNSSTTVALELDKRQTDALMNGVLGKMKRLNEVIVDLKPMIGMQMFPLPVSFADQTATRILYNPQATYDELINYPLSYEKAYNEISNMKIDKAEIDKQLDKINISKQ